MPAKTAVVAIGGNSLLQDMATIAANRIQPSGGLAALTVITTPTPVQRRAFEFLGVSNRLGYT
jgi:hypothetical protein